MIGLVISWRFGEKEREARRKVSGLIFVMDEEEAASFMQSQLEAEEYFGSTSYASFQVPAPTNAGGSNAKTVKAFKEAIVTDSDSSAEEDDADFGDDIVSPHEHSDMVAARTMRSQSSAATIVHSSINNHQTAFGPSSPTSTTSSFIPAVRSRTLSRSGGPIISSARAKPISAPQLAADDLEPPPLLSAISSLPPPPELPKPIPSSFPSNSSPSPAPTSSLLPPALAHPTSSNDADDEPPPPLRLPDLPTDMPVFRPSSYVLHSYLSLSDIAPFRAHTRTTIPISLLMSFFYYMSCGGERPFSIFLATLLLLFFNFPAPNFHSMF